MLASYLTQPGRKVHMRGPVAILSAGSLVLLQFYHWIAMDSRESLKFLWRCSIHHVTHTYVEQ